VRIARGRYPLAMHVQQSALVLALAHLVLTGVSVYIAAKLVGARVRSFGAAVFFAFVIAILNAIAWHFFAPLTVTFTVLTLGIGGLIINGILFLMAGRVAGVEFSGCITAALASLGVTLINWGMQFVFGHWAP
jgi:putative membrane protein